MARQLESFDFGRGRPKGTSRYDWDHWLDGSIWELTQGLDFQRTVEEFRNVVYVTAARRGIKVRTSSRRGSDVVVVQAYQNFWPPKVEEEESGHGTG